MTLVTALLGLAALAAAWFLLRGSALHTGPAAKIHDDKESPHRDLSANVNPSQLGNEVDLWPDRTGARTRRELGARHAADVTFVGDAEEHKGPDSPP